MRIKKRLQINVAVTVITALAICLVLFLSLHRVNRANHTAKIAGEIITSAYERVTFRNDYMRTNSARAKEQWSGKHYQLGGLLKSAAANFRDAGDRKNIDAMIKNQESIGKIFSSIVANRENAGLKPDSADLSHEVEERLLTQLNMRVYDEVIHCRQLLESSRQAHASALKQAVLGIVFVLVIVIAAAAVNSWTMGRAITNRIRSLREGTEVIGGGGPRPPDRHQGR